MKRLILLGLFTLILAPQLVLSQTKKIHVIPDNAKIYVDGNEVGNGSYEIKFNRTTDFFMLKFECPGYITKQVKLMKNNPNKTIAYKMDKDEFYLNSFNSGDGSLEMANNWFEITVRDGLTEDQIWKKLMSIVSNNFDNIEIRDKSAGWIRTAWAKTMFETQVVRTRLEIKINTDIEEEITYRVRISSEVNNDPDCSGDDCFEKSERILKKYAEVLNELQNKLN